MTIIQHLHLVGCQNYHASDASDARLHVNVRTSYTETSHGSSNVLCFFINLFLFTLPDGHFHINGFRYQENVTRMRCQHTSVGYPLGWL